MPQGAPSLVAFSIAMRKQPGFGDRVASFEARFGTVDDGELAVLAQAAYLCWGNNEYRHNLHETCSAIGTGRPTGLYYHRQITRARWRQLQAYGRCVLRWTGTGESGLPRPDAQLDARVRAWLGKPSSVKTALAEVFLCNLYLHIAQVSIGPMSACATRGESRRVA